MLKTFVGESVLVEERTHTHAIIVVKLSRHYLFDSYTENSIYLQFKALLCTQHYSP